MGALADTLFYFAFGSAFIVMTRFIYKAHSFLNRLIEEGKIEGPGTGELQSELIGWCLNGNYPSTLDVDDRETAVLLGRNFKMAAGLMILCFILMVLGNEV